MKRVLVVTVFRGDDELVSMELPTTGVKDFPPDIRKELQDGYAVELGQGDGRGDLSVWATLEAMPSKRKAKR